MGLCCLSLLRDHRTVANRLLALGLTVGALESFFNGLSGLAQLPGEVMQWQQWRFVMAALFPGAWLLFGICFARSDPRPAFRMWRWVVLGVSLVLLVLPLGFAPSFLLDVVDDPPGVTRIVLGWSGYAYHLIFLLTCILTMVVLERVLRAATGKKRWYAKFLVLGVDAFLAIRIYTVSQTLLFHSLDLSLEPVNAGGLIVGCILILIAVLRAGVVQMDIFFSQRALYNSITIIMVGVYFTILAVSAEIFGDRLSESLVVFLLFLAVLMVPIFLLSDKVKQEIKQFISRNIRPHQFNYRAVWMRFSEDTSAVVDPKKLGGAAAKAISEILDVRSVSVWLMAENSQSLELGGSTAIFEAQIRNSGSFREELSQLVRLLGDCVGPVDLEKQDTGRIADYRKEHLAFLESAKIRTCVPLRKNDDLLGLVTLDHPEPLTLEESELLESMCNQISGSLFNLKLSEGLRQMREVTAFQNMAAFFIHDLKNVASKLSMTLENMEAHLDNPEFRKDALQLMSQSVDQIKTVCSQLSSLREKTAISPVESDLNRIVKIAIRELNGVNANVRTDFGVLPKLLVDPNQVNKVVTNLLLNACEAVEETGEIRVQTTRRNGWVELTVTDDGCGMSKAYMDECLFRPFKTTKKKGLGIGLFQSKMIVEAHKGRIEVESREGEGTMFRVLLPI